MEGAEDVIVFCFAGMSPRRKGVDGESGERAEGRGITLGESTHVYDEEEEEKVGVEAVERGEERWR